LPVENETINVSHRMFYCADPRDGTAHFQFARPRRLGYGSHRSERVPYLTVQLPVDPFAQPFLERLETNIAVDHNYVVSIHLKSCERKEESFAWIYDLEFALDVVGSEKISAGADQPQGKQKSRPGGAVDRPPSAASYPPGQIAIRSNVVGSNTAWHQVPGDAIAVLKPNYFVHGVARPTREQLLERLYYHPCSECGKSSFESQWFGCDRKCKGVPLPHEAEKRRAELGLGA
jgi:hypothetical protein